MPMILVGQTAQEDVCIASEMSDVPSKLLLLMLLLPTDVLWVDSLGHQPAGGSIRAA